MTEKWKKLGRSAARDATRVGGEPVAPLATDLRTGTRLAGYELGEIAGRGGMGVVYRAEHRHLQRTVAVKLLAPELAESEEFRERFARESRTAAAIDHPNIVTVYDAGEADGLLYIAMRFVEGTDLGRFLAEQGRLELPLALSLLEQVGSALDAAHAHGIVHGDVKPANVLLRDQQAYLTDFGLTSRIAATRARFRREREAAGTIDYMAPEQVRGSTLDARTDVYAFGCLAFHLLTGVTPYEHDADEAVLEAHLNEPPPRLHARRPDLQPGIGDAITQAMAKDPDDRPATCAAVVARMVAAAGGGDTRAPAAPTATVLVAGAQPSARALVRTSLAAENFRLVDVEWAQTAERVRAERAVLVVVGLSDLEAATALCHELRADPETARVKLLALGSRAQLRDRQALHDAGFDEAIATPFSPLQLLTLVRQVLGPDALTGSSPA